MEADTRAMELLRNAVAASEEVIQRHRRTVEDCRAWIGQAQEAIAEEEAAHASFEEALHRLEAAHAAADVEAELTERRLPSA